MNAPEQPPAQGPSSQPPPAPVPAVAATAAPAPKSRRWKKILLISGGSLGVLILLVLLLGPAVIGSVVAAKIPAVLAEQLQVTATVGSVSFSWSGHVQIDE